MQVDQIKRASILKNASITFGEIILQCIVPIVFSVFQAERPISEALFETVETKDCLMLLHTNFYIT